MKNNQKTIKKRTIAGLKEARRKGKIGGRPSVSIEVIQKILLLHHNGVSYQEIAEECSVSLATVYKYTK